MFHANEGTEKKKKTELTVNDNPGSVSHQDPIERIEEDASSTYFSSTRREQSHRKRFSLSCPDLTRFKIIASNDRVVAHRIPWITKDRVKFETEFRKNSNRIKWYLVVIIEHDWFNSRSDRCSRIDSGHRHERTTLRLTSVDFVNDRMSVRRLVR